MVDYTRVDPHVHCRDGEQAYKTTIKEVFLLADEQGVQKIFDMPNTKPAITHEKHLQDRLLLVPKDREEDYYVYMGATNKPEQLEEAVKCYKNYKQVIGIKLFAGKSVGDLEIIEEKKQLKVYQTLAELGYEGVIAVHCEKEEYMKGQNKFNPRAPMMHAFARPRIAEIESAKDQIKFIYLTNFKGTLHICHVSCPETVNEIQNITKIK